MTAHMPKKGVHKVANREMSQDAELDMPGTVSEETVHFTQMTTFGPWLLDVDSANNELTLAIFAAWSSLSRAILGTSDFRKSLGRFRQQLATWENAMVGQVAGEVPGEIKRMFANEGDLEDVARDVFESLKSGALTVADLA